MTIGSPIMRASAIALAVVLMSEGAWAASAVTTGTIRMVLMVLAIPATPGLVPSILIVGLSHAWRHAGDLTVAFMQIRVATPINLVFWLGMSYLLVKIRHRKTVERR